MEHSHLPFSNVGAALLGVVLAGLWGGAVNAAAQALPMRAGLWELTVQVDIPDMPQEMPAVTSEQCITDVQVQAPAEFLARDPVTAGDSGDSNCTLEGYQVNGQDVTWQMACVSPVPLTGEGSMAFSGDDRYTGAVTLATELGPMTLRYAGVHIGACEVPTP